MATKIPTKIISSFILLSVLASAAYAVTAPVFDSVKRIDAIIKHDELGKDIGVSEIVDIKFLDKLNFVLKTKRSGIFVGRLREIAPPPGPIPPPVSYQVDSISSAADAIVKTFKVTLTPNISVQERQKVIDQLLDNAYILTEKIDPNEPSILTVGAPGPLDLDDLLKISHVVEVESID